MTMVGRYYQLEGIAPRICDSDAPHMDLLSRRYDALGVRARKAGEHQFGDHGMSDAMRHQERFCAAILSAGEHLKGAGLFGGEQCHCICQFGRAFAPIMPPKA
jgi:hypothetical protein